MATVLAVRLWVEVSDRRLSQTEISSQVPLFLSTYFVTARVLDNLLQVVVKGKEGSAYLCERLSDHLQFAQKVTFTICMSDELSYALCQVPKDPVCCHPFPPHLMPPSPTQASISHSDVGHASQKNRNASTFPQNYFTSSVIPCTMSNIPLLLTLQFRQSPLLDQRTKTLVTRNPDPRWHKHSLADQSP